MKTVKFGGTSLADATQFRKAAEIVRADPARRYVVVSAPGKRNAADEKVTDLLYRCWETVQNGRDARACFARIAKRFLEIADGLGLPAELALGAELEQIYGQICHGAGRDHAASRGEYLSARIFAAYLHYDLIDAATVVLFDRNGHFDAEGSRTALRRVLQAHSHAVIPGFYGALPDGTVKTFSRGGSDVTGAIVAEAMEAELYENWTDVSGILLADPRMVRDPLPVQTVTYRELRALSHLGASVFHEEAVFPAWSAGIPIHVCNTNDPAAPGTLIVARTEEPADRLNGALPVGVTGRRGFSMITMAGGACMERGACRRVPEVLEGHGVPLLHLPLGVDTIRAIVPSGALEGKRRQVLDDLFCRCQPESVICEEGVALLAVVGRGMAEDRGAVARVLGALAQAGIRVLAVDLGAGVRDLVVGVAEAELERAVNAVYQAWHMERTELDV